MVIDAGGDEFSSSLFVSATTTWRTRRSPSGGESADAVGGQEGLAEGDELVEPGAEGFDFQVRGLHVSHSYQQGQVVLDLDEISL